MEKSSAEVRFHWEGVKKFENDKFENKKFEND